MNTFHRVVAGASSALALSLAGTAAAWAGGPTLEPFHFEITEQDALMTESCGFPVDVHIVANGLDRTFQSQPGGMRYLGTIRADITFSANGNAVTFRERGQERAVVQRDGSFTFSYTGRFFGDNIIGRLVYNGETGEIESQTGTTVDRSRLCSTLAS
jgi:hypothetical protein